MASPSLCCRDVRIRETSPHMPCISAPATSRGMYPYSSFQFREPGLCFFAHVSFSISLRVRFAMADAITEIVYLPLKPNLDLSSGDHKAVLDDTLNTIARQKGLTSLVWGRQVEKLDVLEIVQGTFASNVESHQTGSPPLFHSLACHVTRISMLMRSG